MPPESSEWSICDLSKKGKNSILIMSICPEFRHCFWMPTLTIIFGKWFEPRGISYWYHDKPINNNFCWSWDGRQHLTNLCWLALGGRTVKNLCLLASKFELNQSQCKSSQVDASQRKWVAKQNASWTQVQNLCQLASLFGQGFITFRKCLLFLCFSTREKRMVAALPSLHKLLWISYFYIF